LADATAAAGGHGQHRPSFAFSGIEGIAPSAAPLPERRGRAVRRIGRFKADLAASGIAPGLQEERRGEQRAALEEAAGNLSRPSAERAVFRDACRRLAEN
jgi:hypothetical protein